MDISSGENPSGLAQGNPHQTAECLKDEAWRQRLNEALRTRLSGIIGFSELLSLEPLSPNGRNDLKQILKSARELLDVVELELRDAPNGEAENAPTSKRRSRTCDLLYIEDDIYSVILVERILELRPGLSLKHATQGRRGIEMAANENPKLILLDLNLPDMHGAEVLAGLRSSVRTSGIPVVVLSANAIPTQIERLLSAGARNYLIKPFDIEQFLAVVDEWTRVESGPGLRQETRDCRGARRGQHLTI